MENAKTAPRETAVILDLPFDDSPKADDIKTLLNLLPGDLEDIPVYIQTMQGVAVGFIPAEQLGDDTDGSAFKCEMEKVLGEEAVLSDEDIPNIESFKEAMGAKHYFKCNGINTLLFR